MEASGRSRRVGGWLALGSGQGTGGGRGDSAGMMNCSERPWSVGANNNTESVASKHWDGVRLRLIKLIYIFCVFSNCFRNNFLARIFCQESREIQRGVCVCVDFSVSNVGFGTMYTPFRGMSYTICTRT